MVTLYEFVYDELGQPESIDLVGLGAGQSENDNQWLYRMNRGFSETEGVESVEDYWLGLENDITREYDITGDVFKQDFETDILDSEASLLVVPKPSIYRPTDEIGNSYVQNYEDLSGLVNTELDGVLMREVDRDIESAPLHAEYEKLAQNFREGFRKKSKSMVDIGPEEMANMLTHQDGISATNINWQPEAGSEQMILVKERGV